MKSDEQLLGAMFDAQLAKIEQLENEIKALKAELETYKASEQHIIELRDDGWTIQHPLSCRPNLFDCIYNMVAGGDLVDAAREQGQRGRFYCDLSEDGRILGLEPVK